MMCVGLGLGLTAGLALWGEGLLWGSLAGLAVTRGSKERTTKTGFMFWVRDGLVYAKEFLYRH